jgi:hypothetical protein
MDRLGSCERPSDLQMRALSDSAASVLLLCSRGKQASLSALVALCPWRDQPSRALRQPLLTRALARLLPRPCLPLLHGHYPASLLLRRLCHLPGTALRAFGGHELRRCSRIVIPDSRHNAFQPFCLQPPTAFHWLCDHCLCAAMVAGVASPFGWASGSGLRLYPADSSMQ